MTEMLRARPGMSEACAVCLLLSILVRSSWQGPNERRLLAELFTVRAYNRLERPVQNESDALVVSFGLTLQQIIDVDEKNQIINTNLWLNMGWVDYNLRWNETDYGGIKSIRLPPALIWKPDVLLYNSADEDIDSAYPTNVVVSSTGECLWVPPGLFLSTCTIDITWFPFDDQFCKMKFGSWTYDSSGIDLQLQAPTGDLTNFIDNGEWQLIGMPAVRNVVSYECCPQKYIDVTFTVHIRRRTLFYAFNLIVPCALISSTALLTFTLPPESGEKISLGVTILLSLTVFLLLVAEAMPPTSDALPLIGMYFAAIMIMCSLSVVFTVLVLNYHHRSPAMHVMPSWVKKVICDWLAWLVRMKRPDGGRSGSPDVPEDRKDEPESGRVFAPEFSRLASRFSKSLLKLDDSISYSRVYVNRNGTSFYMGVNSLARDNNNSSRLPRHHHGMTSYNARDVRYERLLKDDVMNSGATTTDRCLAYDDANDRDDVTDVSLRNGVADVYPRCDVTRERWLSKDDVTDTGDRLPNEDDADDVIDRGLSNGVAGKVHDVRRECLSKVDGVTNRASSAPGSDVLVGRLEEDARFGGRFPSREANRWPDTCPDSVSVHQQNIRNARIWNIRQNRPNDHHLHHHHHPHHLQHDPHQQQQQQQQQQQRPTKSSRILYDPDSSSGTPRQRHVTKSSDDSIGRGGGGGEGGGGGGGRGWGEETTVSGRNRSETARSLTEILAELRYLTNHMRETKAEESECGDWKFAAMVIDRLCLICFTIFTVVTTFAILLSAPHVSV